MVAAPSRLTCEVCGAAVSVEAGQRTATCAFCASPQVVLRPADPGRPEPVFAIGFVQPREAVLASVHAWLKRRSIFTHSGVKHAPVEEIRGVYVPAYLYGALARSRFTGECGYAYRNGKENETEWRTVTGLHAAYVSDVLVTASRGIGNVQLENLEPFDLRQIRRYAPAMVAGWIAEDASRTREECLELARAEAREKTAGELHGFLPGERRKALQHATQLERESLDLVLVPVWVLALRHDPRRPPFQLLVNGESGRIAGKAPLSWRKIAAAVILGLALVAGVALAVQGV